MITPSFSLTATERVLPRLALDFTTASLDARVTFARSGATATRVNSSGFIEAVAADVARFDFNPVTLACRGLLIEESRANLALYSEQFNDAVWSKANSSVDQDLIVSPDGTQNADFLKENSATSTHFVSQLPTLADNTAYAVSCYAKKGTRNWLVLGIVDKAAASKLAYFDLNAGTLGNVSSGVTSAISDADDGWYRCTAIVNSASGATAPQLRVMLASANGTFNYAGDGTSGLYIWGAQLETGAFATSYIPTEATALTRNADVATMTGTNFSDWFNASEGSVVAEFTPQAAISAASTAQLLYEIGNGSSGDRFRAFRNNDDGKMFLSNNAAGSANVSAIGGVVSATGVKIKTAAAYKLDNFGIATSGNAAATDTSATVCTADQMRIGRGYNNANYLNGILAKLFYYPQRLTNAELQAFSK
jgi:hypothetical protein